MNNEEKRVIKECYNLRYPPGTHELNLDVLFDYYAGLFDKALHNKKNLEYSPKAIDESDVKKITDYISKNKDNNNGKEMEIYYQQFKEAISILNKYYDTSGNYKEIVSKNIHNAIKQDTIRLILLLIQCSIAVPLFLYSKENEIIFNSKDIRETILIFSFFFGCISLTTLIIKIFYYIRLIRIKYYLKRKNENQIIWWNRKDCILTSDEIIIYKWKIETFNYSKIKSICVEKVMKAYASKVRVNHIQKDYINISIDDNKKYKVFMNETTSAPQKYFKPYEEITDISKILLEKNKNIKVQEEIIHSEKEKILF